MVARATTPFGLYKVTESGLFLRDNTIANVSTSRHGLVPKAPNDLTKALLGDGNWGSISSAALPSWLANHADAPPGTPDAFDEEFDAAHSLTWTADPGSAIGGSQLILTPSTNSSMRIGHKAIAATGKYRMKVLMGGHASNDGNTSQCGFALYESGTGKTLVWGLSYSAGAQRLHASRWSSLSSFIADVGTNRSTIILNIPFYLEVEVLASTYVLRYSFTGRSGSYIDHTTAINYTTAFTIAADKIGIFVLRQTTSQDATVYCDFIRKVA